MDAILTKWVGLFLTGLKLAAGSIVGRVMSALGLSWVSLAYTLPAVKSWLASKFSGMPQVALDFMTASGVDILMTLILSAIVARMGMRTFLMLTSKFEELISQETGT